MNLTYSIICSSQNGWEPEENIYSKDLIYEYEKNQELEEKKRLAAVKRTLMDSSNVGPAAKRIKLGNEVCIFVHNYLCSYACTLYLIRK